MIITIKSKIDKILTAHGQTALLKYWSCLYDEEREAFYQQVHGIDWELFAKQQAALRKPKAPSPVLSPFQAYAERGDSQAIDAGMKLIKDGAVGCLIVAGGQGTRLQFKGPKGMFPITEGGKTLFQLFAEEVVAMSKESGKPLKLAIMTSPQNDAETHRYFRQNYYFGLEPKQISFFQQGQLPLLKDNGDLFLDSPNHIAEGPNGNGVALKRFFDSGLWAQWQEAGVQYLTFIQVDNPLAKPFDANLVGQHALEGNDVTLKCIFRDDPHEKVGVVVDKAGKAAVVEYSEISSEEKRERDDAGHLKHALANISQFCFSMDFVQSIAKQDLPLHLAHKAAKYYGPKGEFVLPTYPQAWKFETFIFDTLDYASKVSALVYPREECHAPLKNLRGPDSVATVREALRSQ